jgi:hypothetical protein
MENLQPFMVKKLGRCPSCRGILIKEVDSENRVWARCLDCSIRIPVGGGSYLKGKPDKPKEELC